MTTELATRPSISDEDKLVYAGIWLLKKMDLAPKDGGMVFSTSMPSELTPLDEVLFHLAGQDLVTINRKKERWELTPKGVAHIASLIEEAEDLVEEFDDQEVADTVAELRRRNLDPFRARFLWGWYDGEFDDLVLYQQRRGLSPIQTLWAYFLTDDEFYADLARDLQA